MPSALFHIFGNTVFLRLSDVTSGLPDYDEQILLSSMDSEEDATGYSQRSAHNTVFEELRKELATWLPQSQGQALASRPEAMSGLSRILGPLELPEMPTERPLSSASFLFMPGNRHLFTSQELTSTYGY